MSCEDFLRIFRENASFNPQACRPQLRREIEHWNRDASARPDYACLEEAWEFGRKMSGTGGPAQATDVADLLSMAIVEGKIPVFDGLSPGIVDSHVLTSKSPVSRLLCDRLRLAMGFVRADFGGGAGLLGSSGFVRAVVLGFRWDEVPAWGGSLAALARGSQPQSKVTSAEFLLAFRFASAMLADRKAVMGTEPVLQASCDQLHGVCEGIAAHLRETQFPAGDEESRKVVVKVIELQQFVQGMVDVLAPAGIARAEAIARAHTAFDLGSPGGRISHLREYVALGTPLIDLVGPENQVDVRRDIERIMERIDQRALPGFPHINSVGSSRRASELLRRLRFLVRAMVLEASKPGADSLFHNFRNSLFHGTGRDARLDAARIAFERPSRSPGWKPSDRYDESLDPVYLGLRAKVQNLISSHGFDRATPAAASAHPVVGALRGAVKIDTDTWSDAFDGDSTALPKAIYDILRDVDSCVRGIDEEQADDLMRSVFDNSVLASAMGSAEETSLGAHRDKFFRDLHRELMRDDLGGQPGAEESVVYRRVIEEGVGPFQDFIRANFHREFDRPRLQRMVEWQLFDDDDVENGEACRAWLQSWAFVSRSRLESAGDLVSGQTAAELQDAVKAQPYEPDEHSGGPLIFRYMDAAAEGKVHAQSAVEAIVTGPSASLIIGAFASDDIGRPFGLVLAQGGSSRSLDALYGPGRSFDVGFGPSVDGVTPLMAAVRFPARRAEEEHQHRQRIERVMALDPLFGGKDAHHDSRGWRVIHHAFASGNLAAAKLLFDRDRSCIAVREKDRTTFLIEAIRHQAGMVDPGEVFRAAWEMLKTLPPAEQAKVLAFKGPESPYGTHLSLVSAALRTPGRWTHLLEPLTDSSHRESMLSSVNARELSLLLREDSDQKFSLFCQQLAMTSRGRQGLKATLDAIEPSPAIVAVNFIRSNSRRGLEHAVRAISQTQRKLKDLQSLGALDLEKHQSFSRNNALHELVECARRSAHRDETAGQLYELGWDMIQSAPSDRRFSIVTKQNLEGETPIWLATRFGVHSLALAYSQYLGSALGESDDVWLQAARVIRDPERYQDGVDRNRRLFVDGSRQLCLGWGVDRDGAPRILVLSPKPLPEDMHTRSARKWLVENANRIAESLGKHFAVEAGIIPASAFANWLAHLATETGDGPSPDSRDRPA